jgi:alpha-tubulin suppressor-like RCC1 family protein
MRTKSNLISRSFMSARNWLYPIIFLFVMTAAPSSAQELPDLVMTAVSGPASGATGGSLAISSTVKNNGTAALGFYVAIYLSTDNVITPSDTYLGSRQINGLAPGASHTGDTTFAIPNTLPGGTYYIGAIADMLSNGSNPNYSNLIKESDETNNALAGNAIVVTGPDLIMTTVSGPATGLTGNQITINSTVATTGGGSSGFYVAFYLSSDNVITPSDTYLGFRYVSSLEPGASHTGDVTFAIPSTLPGGTYYIGAIADMYSNGSNPYYANLIKESDETNNAFAGSQIVVTGPDLVMTTVSGPATGVAGDQITINSTVATTGGASSGFYVAFYLSSDNVITPSDMYLGFRYVSSLEPGASHTGDVTFAILSTLPGGTYYIGAIADMYSNGSNPYYANLIKESDETNNAFAGSPIVVTGPDLVITTVSGPATGLTGGSVTISSTVATTGGGSTGFYVSFYLSIDNVITTSDTYLGSRKIISLAPGASNSGDVTFTVPNNLPGGTYYIGAIADSLLGTTSHNVVAESDETNNALAGNQITVTGPDLVMTTVSGPATGLTGESVTVSSTVATTGGGSSGFYVSFYLSSDNVITTSDMYLGSRKIISLAPGASNSGDVTFTVPNNLPGGTYYIGAIADSLLGTTSNNVVAESDETNNALAGNQIYIGIDTTPPVGSVSINSGAAATNNAIVTLTLSATDSQSGVSQMQFSNDNLTWAAAESYSTTKTWTLTAVDGPKTVYAKFKDVAGNWSSAYSSSIMLDTAPPTVTITSPAAGVASSTPLLSYTVTDGTVVVQVDGVIVPKVSGDTLDALSDGPHTVRVEATDAAGNAGFAEVAFTVNTAPPTISIISPVAGITNNKTPVLSYSVSSGTVVVSVDGIVVSKVSGDSLEMLEDGQHTVRVESSNTSGTAVFSEVTFTVDTTPAEPYPQTFKQVSAGGFHTVALTLDGRLWAWGYNEFGQLGDGTTITRLTPVQVGEENTWAAIAAGDMHTLALKSDGTLWAWGSNESGQLGDRTTTPRITPVKIGEENTWATIAAGAYHSLALKSDGTLWTWGNRVGTGSFTPITSPVEILSGVDRSWTSSACGFFRSFGMTSDGYLWGWGDNTYGSLGDGTGVATIYPTRIGSNDNRWFAVVGGGYHSMGLKSDGTLWAWGENRFGELGNNTNVNELAPVLIDAETTWTKIDAGYGFSTALKFDGTLWTWGWNDIGQLGDGSEVDKSVPGQVGTGTTWVSIAAGDSHAAAVKADGSLWLWGNGYDGQLGDNASDYATTPRRLGGAPITINDDAPYTDAALVMLRLMVTDANGVAEMQFSNDGTTWSAPEPYATTKVWTLDPGQGVKTVSVMFLDAAGNWSSAFSATIMLVNTLPPDVSVTSPAAGITKNNQPLLVYTISDGTVTVKVDGIVVNKISGDTLDMLSDGVHTVRVEAENASIITGFAEMTFTVDTTAPTVSITLPYAGTTNNKTPVLTYTVSEGTVVVKVDGVAVNKVSGSTLNTLTEGSHVVRVEATDAAGNTGSAQVTFTVDTVPPIVTITSPVAGVTNLNSPLLLYTVSDGIVVVKLDGIVINKVSGATLDALVNGSHVVRVEAADIAGNIGFAEVVFTVDAASGGNDDANPYCLGTATYLAGPSSFTSGIIVPPAGSGAVNIASPYNGATVNGPKVIVKGAMDTTVPVMSAIVTVKSQDGTETYRAIAHINGQYFAAQVQVAADTGSITVIVTDQNNAQHQASVSVYPVIQSSTVDLIAVPGAGIPTLKENGKATLDAALEATASLLNTVASYAWDFSGAGSNNLTCYSHSGVTASYEQTGLYLTQVTVTDTTGHQYQDTVIVNVLDADETRSAFTVIWNRLKTALLIGDIETALNEVVDSKKDEYRNMFTQLGVDKINSLLANNTDFELDIYRDNTAECGVIREESDGVYSYPVGFVKDANGVWKIRGF